MPPSLHSKTSAAVMGKTVGRFFTEENPYPTPPHRRSRIWAGDMAKTPGKFFTTGKPSKGPPRLPFGLRTKDNNRYDRKEISDQQ